MDGVILWSPLQYAMHIVGGQQQTKMIKILFMYEVYKSDIYSDQGLVA